jgi:hypothetical protein
MLVAECRERGEEHFDTTCPDCSVCSLCADSLPGPVDVSSPEFKSMLNIAAHYTRPREQ